MTRWMTLCVLYLLGAMFVLNLWLVFVHENMLELVHADLHGWKISTSPTFDAKPEDYIRELPSVDECFFYDAYNDELIIQECDKHYWHVIDTERVYTL